MKERETETTRNFIFIANHQKWIDPWIIWSALYKLDKTNTLRPMMSDRLSKTPAGFFLKCCGAFAANSRHGLDKSLETPIKYLEEGHSVLIFPQGAPRNGERETKPGARELSIRTNTPIIPILIQSPNLGAKEIFVENHEICVTVGEPFIPTQEEDVMERVWRLKTFDPTLSLSTGPSISPLLVEAPVVNISRIYFPR